MHHYQLRIRVRAPYGSFSELSLASLFNISYVSEADKLHLRVHALIGTPFE